MQCKILIESLCIAIAKVVVYIIVLLYVMYYDAVFGKASPQYPSLIDLLQMFVVLLNIAFPAVLVININEQKLYSGWTGTVVNMLLTAWITFGFTFVLFVLVGMAYGFIN